MPLSQQKLNKLIRASQRVKKEQVEPNMTAMLNEMRAILEREMKEKLDSMMEEVKKRNALDPEFLEDLVRNVAADVLSEVKGDKGDPGEAGFTPRVGVDFMTDSDVEDIIKTIMSLIRLPEDGVTPEAGVDFPTKKQVEDIIEAKFNRVVLPSDGHTPKKGVDFMTEQDIKQMTDIVHERVLTSLSPKELKLHLTKIGLEHTAITDWREAVLAVINQNVGLIRSKVNKSGGGAGGGSSNTIVETPTGDVDGVNTTYTLTSSVKPNTLQVYWNGQHQRPGAANEYTLSGKVITFNDAPSAGSIFVVYQRNG